MRAGMFQLVLLVQENPDNNEAAGNQLEQSQKNPDNNVAG